MLIKIDADSDKKQSIYYTNYGLIKMHKLCTMSCCAEFRG